MTKNQPGVSFPAFGGIAVVAVVDPAGLDRAHRAVAETVAEFDVACSRFRSDSELASVNRAAGSPVHVGPLLLEAVEEALRAARLTDGDVDPTVGRALVALGYDRDFDLIREHGAPTLSIAPVPGWQSVHVHRNHSTIHLAPGVGLDLGATAKALAADRAAERACAAAGCGVLVSLSGDLALAGDPPDGGWRVRVSDDHRAGVEAPGQWIALSTGGLATSSTTVRRWSAGSREAHHVVDPATGLPAPAVWDTVSVAAASCLDANIASTAAIVRGGPAVDWLQSLCLPSRLVRADRTVLHLAGWPTAGDDLAAADVESTKVPA
jgi:thiamine biosynthesis lipoprotein